MAHRREDYQSKEKIFEIKRFAEIHRRWPSSYSNDPEEAKIGKWWRLMKYYASRKKPFKRKRISSETADEIRKMLLAYPTLEFRNRWNAKFRKVELRILAHRRIWPTREATKEQILLMAWWRIQKTNLKNFRKGQKVPGMNEERARKVEYLMKYAKPTRPKIMQRKVK